MHGAEPNQGEPKDPQLTSHQGTRKQTSWSLEMQMQEGGLNLGARNTSEKE